MSPSARVRPVVTLLAHSVHDEGKMAGGMEIACVELVRRGHREFDFVVISSDLAPDLRDVVDWKRVWLPMRPAVLRFLVFFVVAGWRLRRVDADIRHAVGAIVPNRISLSTVHHCHAGFQAKTGRRAPRTAPFARRLNTTIHRFFAQFGERWVYRPERVRCLVAVSDGVADELREHFPAVDVAVIANGVNIERFRPDSEARSALRAETGTPHDEVVALFVGGDWPHKGLEIAIAAVGAARSEGLRIRLWVVGSGDEARFGEIAEANGAGGIVRFFGQRSDTERFYAGADMLVFPSTYEAMSLVAYEAAAAGLPVIATEVSGITELVTQGGAGILVDRSALSVLAAVRRLSVDEELRTSMGSGGRSWASRFTWEASARATFDLYWSLVAGDGQPPRGPDRQPPRDPQVKE